MLTWTKGLAALALGLGVLGLTVGETVFAGDPLPAVPGAGNVNVIQNSGNYKSTTLIVEQGRDGRACKSLFIQGDGPTQKQSVVPEVVPALPVPLDPLPQADPMAVVPPLPADPAAQCPRKDAEDLTIRVPMPRLPQVPGVRMPQLPDIRVPVLPDQTYRVPAGRTMVFNGPGGRTIVSSTGSNSTVIVGGSQGTTILNGPGLVYRGTDRFWTKTMYSKELGATVYYDPRTMLWFRYSDRDDSYRAVPELDDD
jgi:hypothetical protein